jgi:hypothetical protein
LDDAGDPVRERQRYCQDCVDGRECEPAFHFNQKQVQLPTPTLCSNCATQPLG